MAGSKNIIRKQTLHLQYNGIADGFALQKEVNDWCNFNLIPEIEQQLDEFIHIDNYLRIDKLEIQAEVDSKNWKQKVRNDLIFELKQKLNKYKPTSSDIIKTSEVREAKLDTLIIFYLRTGQLPWWGKAFLNNDFKTVFKNWITEEKSAERIELIREELENIVSQKVAVRIVNQVPEKLFFQFLKHIYQEYAEVIFHFEIFFETFILNNISKKEQNKITKPVYILLLYSILKNKGKIQTELILPLIYKELNMFQVLPEIMKKNSEDERINSNPVVHFWQKFILNEQNKKKVQTDIETPVFQEKITLEVKHDKPIEKFITSETADENRDEMEAEIQEGIYIDNAGAVIFAAFIPALFEKLGLAENGKIVNPDIAVSLIQYCVTGQIQNEEYELVLPKILCGLDIDFPIKSDMEISDSQSSEVNSMLQSLINHWPVLKDTSIDGLREAFLNRSGKLSMENEEWVLNVEQKAYDMLLERIPWSFSIIKLPWMVMLLKTEWI